ncbi:hypothetical protein CLF_103923 [Clonorchis sinensis]|uniref:Uncharacterized protein n=1 Tax=Clonorchis sinensis TaxID=79923 RepID=G7YAN6_CLOSI|nr:hypothetical protein CLF_103923 [Clonorchis sinensis]
MGCHTFPDWPDASNDADGLSRKVGDVKRFTLSRMCIQLNSLYRVQAPANKTRYQSNWDVQFKFRSRTSFSWTQSCVASSRIPITSSIDSGLDRTSPSRFKETLQYLAAKLSGRIPVHFNRDFLSDVSEDCTMIIKHEVFYTFVFIDVQMNVLKVWNAFGHCVGTPTESDEIRLQTVQLKYMASLMPNSPSSVDKPRGTASRRSTEQGTKSGPRKLERSMPIQYLRRSTIAQQYRSELAQQLSTCTGSASVDEAWQNVKEAMLAAFSAVCPTSPIRPQNHWISARSLSMIDARKSIQRVRRRTQIP